LEALLRDRIAAHLDGSERLHSCEAPSLVGSNLAARVAPDIFSEADKDGLVASNRLSPIIPGVFAFGDLVLFADPRFRTSQSRHNSFNAELLGSLFSLAVEEGVTVRVRLDHDMIGLRERLREPDEYDYWYGPPFSNDLRSIAPGVARHEAGDDQRLRSRISATEFWWHERDGIHTLEAEELADATSPSDGTFACRYVHSMVDGESGRITHLDGAIRAYGVEEMVGRLGQSIANAERHSQYTKFWRVDGDLPLPTWKLLIHHHFRGNPLIAEYLEGHAVEPGSQGAEVAPADEPVPDDPFVRRLIPYSLEPGVGIRMLLSRQPPCVDPSARSLMLLDTLGRGSDAITLVDMDVVELAKALGRAGEELTLPAGAAPFEFEDRYHTFPVIRHDDPVRVESTLAALQRLLSTWSESSSDRVVTFALQAPFEEGEFRCAVFGHVEDVLPRMEDVGAFFRCRTEDARSKWARTMALRIRNDSGQVGLFDDLVTSHATFQLRRPAIDRSWERPEVTDGRVKLSVEVPPHDADLVSAVENGSLRPAFALLLKRLTCSECGGDYVACRCGGVESDSLDAVVDGGEFAFLFWTDRGLVQEGGVGGSLVAKA